MSLFPWLSWSSILFNTGWSKIQPWKIESTLLKHPLLVWKSWEWNILITCQITRQMTNLSLTCTLASNSPANTRFILFLYCSSLWLTVMILLGFSNTAVNQQCGCLHWHCWTFYGWISVNWIPCIGSIFSSLLHSTSVTDVFPQFELRWPALGHGETRQCILFASPPSLYPSSTSPLVCIVFLPLIRVLSLNRVETRQSPGLHA